MGSSVGPALAKQLIASLGASKVSVQGVDYTATIQSNALRGSEGGKVMAKLANDHLARCASTKIAIAGYSQGAMVVHYAVKSGGLNANAISSAVVYGDPQNRESVGSLPASKTKVSSHHSIPFLRTRLIERQKFCARGDGVCETGGFAITSAHLGKR
jgi:cutinase